MAVGRPDLAMATCTPACTGTTTFCNSAHHCVACLADTDCPLGSVCKVGGPALSTCVAGCTTSDHCPVGGSGRLSCCGGQCLDVSASPKHCGACDMACTADHATPICSAGKCASGTCDPGYADCNADPKDGCEVATRVDASNCTGCGKNCTYAHGVAACADGCYLTGCQAGYDDCDGNDGNGCEVSLDSDAQNCGGCGNKCNNPAHSRGSCAFGACQLSCDNLWGDCDQMFADGCEKSLAADASNCGACGNACAQGLICVMGACTCPQCNLPNASAKCVNNQCVFDKCNPGWSDCDKNINNGCESATDADAKNCGACGNVCPNNMPVCMGSKCQNLDLSNVYAQYNFSGRNVYIWKTPGPCVTLANYTTFCQQRGLSWFTPKAQGDAQKLIDFAFALDGTHTWIQIFGLVTTMGNQATMNGYPVTVDSPQCEQASDGVSFGAIRKWGCSMCNPERNDRDQNNDQSCCWDKGHPYDWFVCE